MGTIIDRLDVARGGWRNRHSALQLAVTAAKTCLEQAGRSPDDLDLLVNVGLFRDRILGEPALAALIQEDLGAHPEDPHTDSHGTFSFDVANGTCGVLTGVQIVDGFLRSQAITRGLVVASDADPGHGMSERFPFSPIGGAVLCSWAADPYGFGPIHWVNFPDGGDTFHATVEHTDDKNILRFHESETMNESYASAAAVAVSQCLHAGSVAMSDIDTIVAAPANPGFRMALAVELGIPESRITVAADERAHTAALVAGLCSRGRRLTPGTCTLVVVAGAGVTAGAALYYEPPMSL